MDVVSRKLKKIQVIAGTHPLPSQTNVDTSLKMLNMVKQARQNDLVLALGKDDSLV